MEEQSSPSKAHSKQPSRREAEGVTPETSSRRGRNKPGSKATDVEGGSGSGPDNQMADVVTLRRENKRLREENALLKTEVASWRAKAKERHAKCIALKAVIKAVEKRLDEPTEGGDVAEIDEAEEKRPTKEEVTKDPDFTRVVTWEERDLPKSRFDESMRPRIVMLPFAQQQALPSFSQSTRKPEPIIFPSPLKGSVRRDRSASPVKQLQITASAARSPSPTKPLSSPTKPRWM